MQLATAGAERDSLAQQNAALASALGTKLGAESSGTAAAVAATAGSGKAAPSTGPRTPPQSETGIASPAGAGIPTPAQMKEIGMLMQRLTKENAALMKAR